MEGKEYISCAHEDNDSCKLSLSIMQQSFASYFLSNICDMSKLCFHGLWQREMKRRMRRVGEKSIIIVIQSLHSRLIRREILDVHIDNGSKKMMKKRSDWGKRLVRNASLWYTLREGWIEQNGRQNKMDEDGMCWLVQTISYSRKV